MDYVKRGYQLKRQNYIRKLLIVVGPGALLVSIYQMIKVDASLQFIPFISSMFILDALIRAHVYKTIENWELWAIIVFSICTLAVI